MKSNKENFKTQSRSNRWNRRVADGAAWSSIATDLAVENEDDDDEAGAKPKRWLHWSSSCFPALGRKFASEPLFSREPVQLTEALKGRIASSTRASCVALITLSALIFSGQEYLPAPWIGNVVAIMVLKSTLGDTILAAKDFFVPMIPVAMVSWGLSRLLDLLSTRVYSIMLPFVVMSGCLIINLCPWPFMKMKNLMLGIFFYISVASPLSLRDSGFDNANAIGHGQKIEIWFVPGLVGTCSFGLLAAVFVHIATVPTPRATTASRKSRKLVKQLAFVTRQLLLSVSEYTQNAGKSPDIARQHRTLIDFYVKKRHQTLKDLESCLPAMRAEQYLDYTNLDLFQIERFVACSKRQQKHAELISLATTQQFLGEDFSSLNETVRIVKAKMSTNLGYAIEQLALEYVKSEHAMFFERASSDENSYKYVTFHELESCVESYLKAMRLAITDAETMLLKDDDASRSTAPLIRQRVAFLGVFSFVRELRDIIRARDNEEPIDRVSRVTACGLISTMKMPWLWGDVGKQRLAVKTAIGMGLASLWVSIPYLRGYVAYPSSVWVGITVASVSLESTGATWVKCLDRLWGTLAAGAFAMLIGKVSNQADAITNLAALVVFIFAATFFTNPKRAYASRYAATSIGSILYGSLYNGIEVDEYGSKRVMLIFTGVVTFLFVEMILFPRSSRTIVEAQSLQFFEDLENFLFDCSKVCASMPLVRISSSNTERDGFILVEDDPLWMLRNGCNSITLTDDLAKAAETVSKTVALAKSQLASAIAEPSFGDYNLDVSGYENLLMEQGRILSQLDLLIITVKAIFGYYAYLPKEHPVRFLHWPALLSASLVLTAQQLGRCVDKLRHVFPHGLCRPGVCEISQVIRAVAVFRSSEDITLDILRDVDDRHASYLNTINSFGEKVRYTPGFRLTLALAFSAILTIGQSLVSCGKNLEAIIQSFPVEDDESEKFPHNNCLRVRLGDDSDGE